MRGIRPMMLLVVAPLAVGVAACGSSSAPAKKGVSSSGSSAQVEVNPPGDIPDNQAFVPYRGAGFSVTVPEGWAQSANGAATVFADKYNSITIDAIAAKSAPSAASAQANELPSVKAHAHGFVAGPITSVKRTAGSAILVNYRAQSPVNAVTGKVALQAVERYEFWRAGREVVLTLAAPVGSDNVDPWRIVTNSFTWTGK